MNVYVDHTVRALAASGHEVDVFTADPHGLGVGDPLGVGDAERARTIALAPNLRLHRLDVDADSKDALAGRLDDLARLLAAHPVFTAADLVWAHYWISAEAALRAVRTRGGPRPTVIASMHTIGAVKNRDSDTAEESPRRLRTEERIAAGVDLLVANTPAERRDLIGELGADPASVVVARPGVDHSLFSPGSRDTARAELGLAADENLVLYVGRMQFIKGTDVVVDALACLHENNPELSSRTRGILLGAASGWVEPAVGQDVFGSGGGQSTLARRGSGEHGHSGAGEHGHTVADREWISSSDFHATLSAAIAAEPNVEVRPPVPAAELVTYYRAADVLLVPSRSESFGLVAAEAAASGLPAIAAAVGGLPEIVENEYSGLLIADHNPRHWALTLERLLGDAELRAELAEHAVARSQRFDWNRTVTAVLDAVAGERRDSARIRSGIGAASGAAGGGQGGRDVSDLTAPGVCGGWR